MSSSMDIDGGNPEPTFEVEAYISGYSSHTKVDRLMFIAEQSRGKPLELQALRLAAEELKQGANTQRYVDVAHKIGNRLGPRFTVDKQWVENTNRQAAQRHDKLESDLQSAKTNLIKESIRQGHNDIGDFYMDRGEFQNAFKSYARSRDYCTTARHIHQMCLNVIKVSIQLNNYINVQNYVTKAEQTPEVDADPILKSKLLVASGLSHLDSKKYKLAARKFVEVNPDIAQSFSEVISMSDIAVYGALTALASFDRTELKTKVLANISFREFLELAPEVRDVVHDFYGSRYGSCLQRLATLRSTLSLDILLHKHLDTLYKSIRQKAVIQYTTPYSSLDLNTMATAFHSPVGQLEKEVAGLIMEGQIKARIDSHSRVLYAQRSNARASAFHKVLSASEEYVRESKALLLRANILQQDLVQKAPRQGMRNPPPSLMGGDHRGGISLGALGALQQL